jgi:RHS repeat-associated protein
MLLSERWCGYGLRSWSRGRCFLTGVAALALVAVLVLLPTAASGDDAGLSSSILAQSAAQSVSIAQPTVAVAPGATVLVQPKNGSSMVFKPFAEQQKCSVGGISAPSFTYSGGLITLPFEGYTTCTTPDAQSGQAILETASGTVVASGTSYNETTTYASSKGVGKSLTPGNYVIVYTETVISPTGWETNAPFCTVNGTVLSCTNTFAFTLRLPVPSPKENLGPKNPASKIKQPCTGDPINCATGNLTETQTDLSVGGRGPGLRAVRSYNSLAAAEAKEAGPFGYGWTGSYSAHLEVSAATETATVFQDNGSTVQFILNSTTKEYSAAAWVQATLKKEGTNYIYTLPNQTRLEFSGEGRLTKEMDRNGNAITLAYNAEKRLETATDGDSRKLTFKYTAGGQVESIKDPMGRIVKYAYESGNLMSVTLPGEESPRWKFEYNALHLMTTLTDGRGNTTKNEYNASHLVSSQTDRMKRKRELEYVTLSSGGIETGKETKIIEPNGSETVETFNIAGLPTKITRASETGIAATTEYKYDTSYELTTITDPNKHITRHTYMSQGGIPTTGDMTSETDPNGAETKWTYDSTHDVETMTTPKGEATTIKRDAHGNPETISRPAPGSTTQTTKYKYGAHGEVESAEDPLKHVRKYEYDAAGDRTGETDPEGDKRTWGYNEDSQETSTVSPRGNVTGGKPTEFTTKIEQDAQGRPLKVTDPLGHETKYAYDGDGNLETRTDPNGNKTKYTYDADNEPSKVEQPNKSISETGYDSAGKVTSQTDGNKHATKYVRNLLEEVTEVADPLGHKTTKEYDKAGNLKSLTDPAKRTATYTYDPDDRLTEVKYSDGKTPTTKYEYDQDGARTVMTDGTGTSKYTYDQLDRLTETENGHKEKTKYEYDLANEKTKITYPNTKSVTRAFDKDGRLEKVTDWSSNVTKFTYDPDSDQATTVFPTGTTNEDKYAYNDADQMSEVKMLKGTETLASLVYTRDSDGQVKTVTSKGLPGEEKPAYEYDSNSRVTKGGTTAYEYDAANNATKIGSGTYKYNAASQLESGPNLTYTYDEMGERTKTKPTSGPATTYGYDEAGNLITVERPKEGETTEIKDTYAYDGNGLRASQTISGTTTYLTWDMTEGLPLILNDTTNSYIYGPGGLPVEQISSAGTVTYLHHDQQGSTRLLTGATGTVTGSTTFDAYGNKTGSTGTSTTPLGYDGQYTSSDTGLIYMRARTYDPATAQFLTIDPINSLTRAPYNYAGDNPVNYMDRTGLCSIVPGSPENCFSEVPGAIVSGVESVAQNPVEAGIALGVIAVGTGGASLVVEGGAASTLGATSVASGAGAAILDGSKCLNGDAGACAGAGLGAAGAGLGVPEVLAAGGFIEDASIYQGLAGAGLVVGGYGSLADLLAGDPGFLSPLLEC